MDFTTQENDIKARLSPLASDSVQVILMPESEEAWTRDFEDARLTVCFNGSDSPGVISTSNVIQNDRLSFAVVIQSRKLRDPDYGIYPLYDKVRKLLVGFSPSSCQKLSKKSFTLISDEEDLFTWFAIFECDALSVEDAEEDNDYPLRITQINVNDPQARVFYNPLQDPTPGSNQGFGTGFN